MTTLSKVEINNDWTLVYDAAVSGPFVGAVSAIGRAPVTYRISDSAPLSFDAGMASPGWIPVELSEASNQKLYAKSITDQAWIVLDGSMAPSSVPSWLRTSDSDVTGRLKMSINEQLIDGPKALTVQSFTALNSKKGSQYEAAIYLPVLAPNTASDLVFVVGDDPVLIKDIQIQFDSNRFSTQVFRNPTYTGGSPVTIYNVNDEQAIPPTSSILAGVTISATGTAVGPEISSLGSDGIGNRVISARSSDVGAERVMWPGATYLFRLSNKSLLDPTRVSGLATWYQGPLSTETPLEL